MMHVRARLVVGVFIGILASSLFFSVPRTRDIIEDPIPTGATSEVPEVSLQDVFKKGVHTLTGSVEASNACANIATEAFHEEAGTQDAHIRVAITLIPYEGTCLQLPTRLRFSVSVSAPAELPITTTINDLPAVLITP